MGVDCPLPDVSWGWGEGSAPGSAFPSGILHPHSPLPPLASLSPAGVPTPRPQIVQISGQCRGGDYLLWGELLEGLTEEEEAREQQPPSHGPGVLAAFLRSCQALPRDCMCRRPGGRWLVWLPGPALTGEAVWAAGRRDGGTSKGPGWTSSGTAAAFLGLPSEQSGLWQDLGSAPALQLAGCTILGRLHNFLSLSFPTCRTSQGRCKA